MLGADERNPDPDDRPEHGANHAHGTGGILINNARLGDLNSRLGEISGSANFRLNDMNTRITELHAHMDSRFDEMKDLWRSELRRVEEVIDARLKHLEER